MNLRDAGHLVIAALIGGGAGVVGGFSTQIVASGNGLAVGTLLAESVAALGTAGAFAGGVVLLRHERDARNLLAQELRLLENQHAQLEKERRETQARSVWAQLKSGSGGTVAELHNASSEPVYAFRLLGFEMDLGWQPLLIKNFVPPGSQTVTITLPEGMGAVDTLQWRFTDRRSVHWVRDYNGTLRLASPEEAAADRDPRWGFPDVEPE